MSTTLTRNSWASLAPTAASVSGSLSQICTASGRGFFLHPPQPVGKIVLFLLHPQKAPGVDHFGRLQADAAEIADDLPKGIVREPGHRCLQHRRIDHQRPDVEGSDPRGQIEVGIRLGLNHQCFRTGENPIFPINHRRHKADLAAAKARRPRLTAYPRIAGAIFG